MWQNIETQGGWGGIASPPLAGSWIFTCLLVTLSKGRDPLVKAWTLILDFSCSKPLVVAAARCIRLLYCPWPHKLAHTFHGNLYVCFHLYTFLGVSRSLKVSRIYSKSSQLEYTHKESRSTHMGYRHLPAPAAQAGKPAFSMCAPLKLPILTQLPLSCYGYYHLHNKLFFKTHMN